MYGETAQLKPILEISRDQWPLQAIVASKNNVNWMLTVVKYFIYLGMYF